MGLCDPEDDLAVMMAYQRTHAQMEAYEAHVQQKEMEKHKGKS
jgi:hypothetical protein